MTRPITTGANSFAFEDPRVGHQFAIAPAEQMAIFTNQIIAVDILIDALLLYDKDFTAQFQQRIQLGNGEFTMVEILPVIICCSLLIY